MELLGEELPLLFIYLVSIFHRNHRHRDASFELASLLLGWFDGLACELVAGGLQTESPPSSRLYIIDRTARPNCPYHPFPYALSYHSSSRLVNMSKEGHDLFLVKVVGGEYI